jgi:phosphate/sulfate permease
VTTTTGLAWESGHWAWNQFGHAMAQFFVSPGLAGAAAVLAAYLAARQVQKTREQDKVTKQLESLWKRFEWLVDRSTPKSNGGGAVLGVRRPMTILASIRVSARRLGDDHLHDMIGTYMENELAESSGIALTAQ